MLDTERLVQKWSENVSQLRREYSWLLFFSVPKLLLLYSLVDEQEPNLAAIVAEISFLFENSVKVRENLTTVLKVSGTQTLHGRCGYIHVISPRALHQLPIVLTLLCPSLS